MVDKMTQAKNERFSLKGIKACLFDFDGVIVDYETLHSNMKYKSLDVVGIAYPENLCIEFQGRPDMDFFNYVSAELAPTLAMSAQQILALKYDLYREHIHNLTLIDGIQDMLAFTKQQFDYTNIVTSSVLIDVEQIIEKFFDRETFDYIVACEDTTRHKPHPDPYQKAMALCGLQPEQCLVIEDSPNGVRAGKSAGCTVVGITTTFSHSVLQEAQADIIVTDYQQLLDMFLLLKS